MSKRNDIHKVLIIGSGPIIIGQACEFDYSGTQACKALRQLGYQIILVNSNPATIMTDPEIADVTYIEPLNVETFRVPGASKGAGTGKVTVVAGVDPNRSSVTGMNGDDEDSDEERLDFCVASVKKGDLKEEK